MNESVCGANCPEIVLTAQYGKTWISRLQLCHWLLLAYPVFLHLVSRNRSADEALVVDESAKYQVVVTAVCGIYVVAIVMRSSLSWIQSLFHRPLVWWTLYLLLAILSSLWSVQPLLTLFRSGQALIFFLLVVNALRLTPSYEDWVRFQLLFGVVLILCATYTFAQDVYPAAGLSVKSLHGWGFPHCLASLFFIGLPLRNQSWGPLLYLILIVLVVSTAAKAYIALVIGFWFFVYFSDSPSRNILLWAASFVLLILLLFFPMEALRLFFPGKDIQMILTGHGRLPVWETMAEEFVVHRPVLGYGFGAGDKLSYLSEGLSFRISHSHNIVLAAVMNLGTVGGSLIAMFCLDVVLSVWRSIDERWRACNIGALTAIIFTTLFTTSISSNVSSTWLNHAMLLAGFALHGLSRSNLSLTRRTLNIIRDDQ